MVKRCCANCIYSYWSLSMKMSGFAPGFPCGPLCANHPDTPGQLRQVSPGGVCRNYRPKPAATEGDIKRIPLGEGQYALVDAADYDWLKQWTWELRNGYAARRENGKVILMHREITKPPDGMPVDHTNHNKLDNCRSNLRVCTRQENARNKRKHAGSSSRFKGVGYCRRKNMWYAAIMMEGLPIWLGYFEDEIEAARAYDRKAVELFGEFAWLNLPEEWSPEQRRQVHADAQPLRDALKAKAAQRKAGEKGKSKKVKGKSRAFRTKTPVHKARKHPIHKAKRTTSKTKRNARRAPTS